MSVKKKPAKKAKTTKETTQRTAGRHTKLTPKMKFQLEKAYRLGLTDAEVAEIVGVNPGTIYNWAKRSPVFFKTIKEDWKAKADKEIERSLRERANGYSHPETKAQYVTSIEGGGRWETINMVKHYPPDPTSMIFWLKNRMPKVWRDKTEHELGGKDGGPIEVQSSAEDKKLLQQIAKELFKKAGDG